MSAPKVYTLRGSERSNCAVTNKICLTKAQARSTAAASLTHRGHGGYYYRCQACRHWHITSNGRLPGSIAAKGST